MEEIKNKTQMKPEKSPIDLVKEVKKELGQYRSPFEKDWKVYDDAYYGKQHKTGEEVKTVKNHIFKIIEGEVPILTDSMPGVSVTANIAEKQSGAEMLNKGINYVLNDQNFQLILPSLVRSGLTSAPGYLYVCYNPDASNGDGKIEMFQIPWKSVYLDGNAQIIEQAEKARIEIPKRKESIARQWPEKKDEILKTQGEANQVGDDANFEKRDVSGLKTEQGKPKQHSAKDIINYVETWIKSYDLEDIEPEITQAQLEEEYEQLLNGTAPDITKWEDHKAHIQSHEQTRVEILSKIGLQGDESIDLINQRIEVLLQENPEAESFQMIPLIITLIDNHKTEHEELLKLNPTSQAPKYKDGWRVIKSVGDVVLYDGPNPALIVLPNGRVSEGHIPLIPYYGYKDDTIYGFGEIKNILDAQHTLNDMDFREFEGLKVCSNPGWIGDHEAEVSANTLTNKPGIVVLKKRGTEIRRLEPGAVSPQLEQRKQLDQRAMEEISGVNEASQGNLPSSASGVAIRQLQLQSVGRIRLKDRYLQNYSIRRTAIIIASLIIKYWSQEKRLRLRSDSTNIEEFLFNPIEVQDLEYTVDIAQGSMAGIDKDALNGFFLNLLGGGHITFEDFLQVADFPKKDLLLKKVSERNDMAAQFQELQAQLEKINQDNIVLRGSRSSELLLPEEKKVFDQLKTQALVEKMVASEAGAQNA